MAGRVRRIAARRVARLALGLLAALGGPPAFAQPSPAAPPEAGQDVPGFVALDRFDNRSKLASSLYYVGLHTGDGDGGQFRPLRLDLFGQYLTRRGYGAYALIGYHDQNVDGADSGSISNLDAGGLFRVRRRAVEILLRAGIVVPLAEEENFYALRTGRLARFHDAAQSVPQVTWLRLSAHPMARRGRMFFKAGGGVDLPIRDGDDHEGATLIDLQAGVGVQAGMIAVMGELVTVHTTEDIDERTSSFVPASARFVGGRARPHVSVLIGLDEDYRHDVDLVLTVGLEYAWPPAPR